MCKCIYSPHEIVTFEELVSLVVDTEPGIALPVNKTETNSFTQPAGRQKLQAQRDWIIQRKHCFAISVVYHSQAHQFSSWLIFGAMVILSFNPCSLAQTVASFSGGITPR